MRGNRFSPGRLAAICPCSLLRTNGALGAIVASMMWGGNRPIGVIDSVVATLFHNGDSDVGNQDGEQRSLSGVKITNYGTVPVAAEIEEEANHTNVVSVTVQPGATVSVPVSITQTWSTVGPTGFAGRWDGLNIRWKIPA